MSSVAVRPAPKRAAGKQVAPAGLSIKRVHAVVNPASGSVGPGAARELADVLAALNLDHEITELEPDGGEDAVRAAVEAKPDLMIVLGGDGTARLVAELCGPDGPLVAPLSGGTMNKLGRSLYGSKPWREALPEAIARGVVRWMPGGEANGRAFYCRAVLGAPALFAQARVAIRAHKIRHAWRGAVTATRKTRRTRLSYDLGGERGLGVAVNLICPTVSRAFDGDGDALEAAVLDLPDAKAGVRLTFSNLFGEWREDPHVIVCPCVSGRAWGPEPIPGMLDGEFFDLGREVRVTFRPHAFRALAIARRKRSARA